MTKVKVFVGSVILILCMFGCIAYSSKKRIFTYEESEKGEVEITGLTEEGEAESDLVIPEKIDGKKVTGIGNSAFKGCDNIESITLPDSIAVIGKRAFMDCEELSEIAIPDSVESIGKEAFLGCTGLTDILVDKGNEEFMSLDGVLFSKDGEELICYPAGKRGKEYIVPNGTVKIGNDAFKQCSRLDAIQIPMSVTKIGDESLEDCDEDLVIRTQEGSYAERYAWENGYYLEYYMLEEDYEALMTSAPEWEPTPMPTPTFATVPTPTPTVAAERVTLKVWVSEYEVEMTRRMCEAFDEYYEEYDCTFDVEGVDSYTSAELLASDMDMAADVFRISASSVPQLVEEGLLYPVTANMGTAKSLYGESAIEACTRDGLIYGIPLTPNAWFVFYNKSMYTEDEVKSLETMMAKEFGEGVYNFSCSISNSWYIEAFFYAAGCTLYGPDGMDREDCTWNNANGVAAANYLIDLANNPKYIEYDWGTAYDLMAEGRLGAYCSGTWDYYNLESLLGDDLGACVLPTIVLNGEECQLSNFIDYDSLSVKSATKHPLAAQLLAEWLGNSDNQYTRYIEVGDTPTCLSLMEYTDVATSALIAQTQYATPLPSISQMEDYWTPVQEFGAGIINGEVTKDNVREKLDNIVNDVTSGYDGW